jgi:hypothetical protein
MSESNLLKPLKVRWGGEALVGMIVQSYRLTRATTISASNFRRVLKSVGRRPRPVPYGQESRSHANGGAVAVRPRARTSPGF